MEEPQNKDKKSLDPLLLIVAAAIVLLFLNYLEPKPQAQLNDRSFGIVGRYKLQ